jgi:hypothetical protein
MSIKTNVFEYEPYDTDWLNQITDLSSKDVQAVEHFFHDLYPDDDDDADYAYDLSKSSGNPTWTIKVVESGTDDVWEHYIKVRLPDRAKADELADLINGTVQPEGTFIVIGYRKDGDHVSLVEQEAVYGFRAEAAEIILKMVKDDIPDTTLTLNDCIHGSTIIAGRDDLSLVLKIKQINK